MIQPIRCFTCGKVIADQIDYYNNEKKKKEQEIKTKKDDDYYVLDNVNLCQNISKETKYQYPTGEHW